MHTLCSCTYPLSLFAYIALHKIEYTYIFIEAAYREVTESVSLVVLYRLNRFRDFILLKAFYPGLYVYR